MSKAASGAKGVVDFFTGDHRACDELWAKVEEAVGQGGSQAGQALSEFDGAMRRHFDMEEQVLFPAFERFTGARGGPTQVMRMEHQQMRGVLDQMAQAGAAQKWEQALDHGDTLMMLIQQHNMKEEGILYPMTDNVLGMDAGDILGRMSDVRDRS